ncbi:MAG: hypothetical protein UV61_C0002G0054 [Candidatus Gottesmanbacteria bacterium GW2011_GWB1_43_11]|uniref:Uncharacterized protein n=1 Tax=Candidatus Gottesmanbacteria bacterium GW2011_GWB1_43_11 TaxID=1618446 RepID=A0A0G1FKC1_9BACT|nr:MAG: hypothetical protein UV17_C0044G0007 [Candidatus Gottesmanbacteria bacterium GW2011_GWA1_42_26]KKS81860.1 MAG: hypothetical protein UV55_C0008G0075 [Candidatus Gottesmanbacteria bacterium GW2011_GWC1_43_10]KKS87333.1 MAG: hypothetical protein UV61_C0002G0054 [Candidatus Gottesmanbacteria bacterium GW2011_GWB1_43_11]OGG09064.1 MAG: hypothetical protein A2699_06870 [Candidatus Gottesmanbacteria bacterium RIFCSPHIGHO2_01_FULL_43_15]HCM37504.1 hypothetical protein [Patescibacteria group bac
MSSTQFWVAVFVPQIIERISPHFKRLFALKEFDSQTQQRVSSKEYPAFYALLYLLWGISLISFGCVLLLFIIIYMTQLVPQEKYGLIIWFGLIMFLGSFMIPGALLDFLFWSISPENFRDYVKFRLIKSGWGYEMRDQIMTLFKIGLIYLLLTSPLVIYLLYLLFR